MPKVQLRYNLREQVKNKMDSVRIEKIDVSKTRWPVNKHMQINDNKRVILESKYRDKVDNIFPKYFPTMSAEEERAQFQFQFKRDLTNKNKLPGKTGILNEAEDDIENPTYSLENLIENLIETSFGIVHNDTEIDFKTSFDYSQNNFTTPEPFTIPNKRSIFIGNATIIINETTVLSMNSTNENLNHNKYEDDSYSGESYKNAFKEMIQSMSENIDQQNNSSIEIMERFIGKRLDVNVENTSCNNDITINATANDITTTTQSATVVTNRSEGATKMKSRQKVTRKQNRKVN